MMSSNHSQRLTAVQVLLVREKKKKKHSTTFTKGKNLENGEALELIKLTLGNAMPKEGLNPPMLPSLSAGEDLEVG